MISNADHVVSFFPGSMIRGLNPTAHCDYHVFRGALFLEQMNVNGEKATTIPPALHMMRQYVRSRHYEQQGKSGDSASAASTQLSSQGSTPSVCSTPTPR